MAVNSFACREKVDFIYYRQKRLDRNILVTKYCQDCIFMLSHFMKHQRCMKGHSLLQLSALSGLMELISWYFITIYYAVESELVLHGI